ncbi:MAG: hypothetical protein QM820_12740 [Minicystis sp.]
MARTWAAGGRARQLPARIRRVLGVAIAGLAAYGGLVLTPQINEMHRQGVQRGVGRAGDVLEAIHRRAESVGKVEVVFGIALVALHVFTLALRRPEDDDDESYAEPLPPGPRGG